MSCGYAVEDLFCELLSSIKKFKKEGMGSE